MYVCIFLDCNTITKPHTDTHAYRQTDPQLQLQYCSQLIQKKRKEKKRNVMSQLMIRELDLFFSLITN